MLVVSNQSFRMVRVGNILILIIALVFVTDGSSIALSPFVYNSLFRQIQDFDTFKKELGTNPKIFFKIRTIFER